MEKTNDIVRVHEVTPITFNTEDTPTFTVILINTRSAQKHGFQIVAN